MPCYNTCNWIIVLVDLPVLFAIISFCLALCSCHRASLALSHTYSSKFKFWRRSNFAICNFQKRFVSWDLHESMLEAISCEWRWWDEIWVWDFKVPCIVLFCVLWYGMIESRWIILPCAYYREIQEHLVEWGCTYNSLCSLFKASCLESLCRRKEISTSPSPDGMRVGLGLN